MLSDLLKKMGIFLGSEFNSSHDSVEWVDLIYRISLANINGDQNVKWKMELHALTVDILSKSGNSKIESWGWKLPESILCLPEILEAFPKAKIIHLTRHPVTTCLRRTHMTSRLGNPIGEAVLRAAYRHFSMKYSDIDSHESYIHNAISWSYQVKKLHSYAKSVLPEDQYLVIKFEDLCQNPLFVSQQINQFQGGKLNETADLFVDKNRIKTYDPNHPEAQKVWSICESIGIELGYSF